MCPGALRGVELARLELYIGEHWMEFAKTATDEDTRHTMALMVEAQSVQVEGWDSTKDCTVENIGEAREVLARIR